MRDEEAERGIEAGWANSPPTSRREASQPAPDDFSQGITGDDVPY